MEIKITIGAICNRKSNANNVVNAYKNAYKSQNLEPDLSESIQNLRQGFLDINRRLHHLEKKIRKE